MIENLKALGTARAKFDGLETFAAPSGLQSITLSSSSSTFS